MATESQLVVVFPISAELRSKVAVETGRDPGTEVKPALDLDTLTVEDRRRAVDAFGLPFAGNGREVRPFQYAPRSNFHPSLIPATAGEWRQVIAEVETFDAGLKRQAGEQAAADAAKRQEALAALEVRLTEWEALDDAALANMPQLYVNSRVALPEGHTVGQRARRDALDQRARAYAAQRAAENDRLAREAAAQREAARAAWIGEHGSPFLRRAVAAGYDCQRRYVNERAALELPGFTVDFAGSADWKSRACPSEAALDDALALREQGHTATVVWLTRPAADRDAYDFEPEEAEALVIEDYLGQYTLIK